MQLLTLPLRAAIRGYQRYISPAFGPRCKYYPTCSAYALSALETHGLCKGLLLILWRFARCNQFSNGGVNYPPLPGQWHAAPYHQMTDAELQQHWQRLDTAAKRASKSNTSGSSGSLDEAANSHIITEALTTRHAVSATLPLVQGELRSSCNA